MNVVGRFVSSMATAASLNGAIWLISTADRNCRAGLLMMLIALRTRAAGSAFDTPARAMISGP